MEFRGSYILAFSDYYTNSLTFIKISIYPSLEVTLYCVMQVMVASGQKNLLEQRMKVCTLLWNAGIKVCVAGFEWKKL